MSSDDEVPLRGGGATLVSRVGGTVHREVGAWTPAVHALLHHLDDVGFDAAPRVHGIDAQGREVLTYVQGEDGHHARNAALHSDGALAGVARLIRRYHDAVAGFVAPAEAQWQFLPGAPQTGLVCHNDLAPVNTIYRDGRPVAFIDWDYAAPAPPVWDLACAAWSFVPLADDNFCRRYGYPMVLRGPRLRLMCDVYGLDGRDRETFLDMVRSRQVASYEQVLRQAERVPATDAELWIEPRGARFLEAISYLDDQRGDWQRELS
jgi:Phosphotransferase enzyme family